MPQLHALNILYCGWQQSLVEQGQGAGLRRVMAVRVISHTREKTELYDFINQNKPVIKGPESALEC